MDLDVFCICLLFLFLFAVGTSVLMEDDPWGKKGLTGKQCHCMVKCTGE